VMIQNPVSKATDNCEACWRQYYERRKRQRRKQQHRQRRGR